MLRHLGFLCRYRRKRTDSVLCGGLSPPCLARFAGSRSRSQRSVSSSASSSSSSEPLPSAQRVLFLCGPTGVGKTPLSLALAPRLNCEIISADSMQVYAGMNVGTDKVSPEDRQKVAHHLVDLVSPVQLFSAGQWAACARAAIDDILSRSKTPLVVGGSGLYVQQLLLDDAASKLPRADAAPTLAERIARERYVAEHYTEAVEELERLDTDYYRRSVAGQRNPRRVASALDKIRRLGAPISPMRPQLQRAALPYDCRCAFVTLPRVRYQRAADLRCERLLQNGLLREVHELAVRGMATAESAVWQALGYRHALEYLCQGDASANAFLRFLSGYQVAMRRLVKTQETWWRRQTLFRWFVRRPDELYPEVEDALHRLNLPRAPRTVHKRRHQQRHEQHERHEHEQQLPLTSTAPQLSTTELLSELEALFTMSRADYDRTADAGTRATTDHERRELKSYRTVLVVYAQRNAIEQALAESERYSLRAWFERVKEPSNHLRSTPS